MITDDMLRAAAHKASEAYTDYYERDYCPENQYSFPPKFERKIQRLKRRADHPVFYKTMHRVASIALAILIISGTWVTANAEARAAVIGWVKEIYTTYIVYIFGGESQNTTTQTDYRPAWLPDGYTESYCDRSEDTIFVAYTNETGQMMNFSYIHGPDETKWLVDRNNMVTTQVRVNDNAADLFISTDSDYANAIMWSDAEDTAFYLSGFVDEAALIRIAESVVPVK